ncbi:MULTISPECIES: hypothetical protein [Halococcus]|uniref:Uncharacterized protein n=1 Tax=Halococcus salifodinae DSM 8989 TaxID=1227456 RepID=M0N406_9EURY|nr:MULTISPECIES: hypothetical protein [Halococcus]EMA52667.1 hypothetical protein C450_11238 [Halococcus salifodinae DSM 8989]
MTSTPNTPVVASPSWRVAIGLIAATVGYLVVLLGVGLAAWGGIDAVYRIPILAVPAAGLVLAVAGGVLIQRERSAG